VLSVLADLPEEGCPCLLSGAGSTGGRLLQMQYQTGDFTLVIDGRCSLVFSISVTKLL